MNPTLPTAALAAAVIATLHGAARADVFIDCTADASVRFLRVEEIANGTPFGRAGIRYETPAWGFRSDNASPEDGYVGATHWDYGPVGVSDGLLPSVGDGWDMTQTISMARSANGYASNVSQLVLEMTFADQTAGASAYSIDVLIDWSMTYSVGRPTDLFDTAVLFASVDGSLSSGAAIEPLPGAWVSIDETTAPTTLTGTNLVHLEVGRTAEDPSAGFARVNIVFTAQGYISTIPAGGPGVVLGVGLGLLGVRRISRR
jgi:hypothetical protein